MIVDKKLVTFLYIKLIIIYYRRRGERKSQKTTTEKKNLTERGPNGEKNIVS